MTCGCECTQDVQEIPTDKSMSLDGLSQLINNFAGATVYFYVTSTVHIEQQGEIEHFTQRGSAPNFAGKKFTLCTCKHDLRTVHKTEDWPGYWIAGFSGISAHADGKQYLLYLMRIGQAFKTHCELWDALDDETRNLKNAATNILGDVFEPIVKGADTASDQYRSPVVGHVHHDSWKDDIYFERNGKSAALLVGDEHYSFCWSEPRLYIEAHHLEIGRQRYARKATLATFIDMLKS